MPVAAESPAVHVPPPVPPRQNFTREIVVSTGEGFTDEEDPDSICAICQYPLRSITSEQQASHPTAVDRGVTLCVMLPCNDMYHLSCLQRHIESWRARSALVQYRGPLLTCPLCRAALSEIIE